MHHLAILKRRFPWAGRAARAAWKLPFKRVTCLTALLFFVGEFYPLSHFPMYSGISPWTYYLYAQDAEGKPLPMLALFGIRTARAKKIYRSYLASLTEARGKKPNEATDEEERAAGEYLLRFLLGNMLPGQRAELRTDRVKLAYVHLSYEQRNFERKERIVASIDLPDAGAAAPQ
jgi:hypothetical protein